MSMSKKHYVAIAGAVNTVLWTQNADPRTIALITSALGDVFAADNERFDRHRFYEACLHADNTVLPEPGWEAYKAERDRLGL